VAKQGSKVPETPIPYPVPVTEERGSTLHREFVGMVFALAIAEVAVEGAPIANSDQSLLECLPAYSHLALAALVIAMSWVGWGRSKHSESNIKSVFSRDFVELLLDLWLVVVYFFIASGVDADTTVDPIAIDPSLKNEKFWLFIALVTYVAWDFLTKCRKGYFQDFKQRAWASILCAILATAAWWWLPSAQGEDYRVILGDVSLVFLVLLFRAMKANDFSKLTGWQWTGIVALFVLFAACAAATVRYDLIEERLPQPAPALAPAA
jgi:hypothetical protein